MLLLPIALVALAAGLPAAWSLHTGLESSKYSCPHGWTRFGSKKCLKYINELQDYERAQSICRAKNQGNLVSIHSHEEQNFVYSYIHSIAASSTPVWLGAKQIDFESILWLDKTENSYTNWAPSEPSHPDEICIAINPRNGMWHDVMCTEANVPACERAPTTQWPFFVAFCSEGWFQFNDEKCVRIISSQALNFYESQELCRSKYNSKLLSIKTDRESEFLHNLIKFRDVKLPVWLGAVQNDFSSFNWIDKTDVTFTNWAEGEPNDPDHACLSMTAAGGKWSDNDCKEQKLILCQKVPEDSACETGWLQFRQDKCYRFVHIRLAFDDAESLCNNLYGGHLPSIHSQEEQFMISQFLASVNVKNGSEIWLGGRQMDFHNFNWGDGSLFNYSYWEHGEPNFPAEKCIEMSWRSGRWNDISCRLRRAVLCERQVINKSALNQQRPNLYQSANCLDFNCTASNPVISIGSASVTEIASAQAAAELLESQSTGFQTASGGPHPVFNSDSSLAAAVAQAQAQALAQAQAQAQAQAAQTQVPVQTAAAPANGFRDGFGTHAARGDIAPGQLQNRTKPEPAAAELPAPQAAPAQEPVKVIASMIQRDQHLSAGAKPQQVAGANETLAADTTEPPRAPQASAPKQVTAEAVVSKAVLSAVVNRKEQPLAEAAPKAGSEPKASSLGIQQIFDIPNSTSQLLEKLKPALDTPVSSSPATASSQSVAQSETQQQTLSSSSSPSTTSTTTTTSTSTERAAAAASSSTQQQLALDALDKQQPLAAVSTSKPAAPAPQ